MALEGDLSEFPLTDIIQLIDLSKKTGAIHLRGQRGTQMFESWLYFRDGKIIGAEIPGVAPLDAVYTCFTLSAGPFRFHDDVVLAVPTITESNEVIIMEGIMRQDAWATIQQHIPSLNVVPRLVPNPSTSDKEINIEAEEWRVLTMVNGKDTIAQIAQRSGIGEFRTCEIMAELLANGLIEKRDPNASAVVTLAFERIATNSLGAHAPALLEAAYHHAQVSDPESATSDQLREVIDYFEQDATRVAGPEKARHVAAALRSQAQAIFE